MSILLVDDDQALLRLLTIRLEQQGYQIISTDDGAKALQLLQQCPVDVVISDLRMPNIDGMMLFEQIKVSFPTMPVILITAHGTIQDAIAATKLGMYGFITKPIDHQELQKILSSIATQKPLANESHWAKNIITRNDKMLSLLDKAGRIALRDVSVLITGASGTGKEVLAQAIHSASPRAKHPFIAINCGAIPENLLESELFGHTKGAFTGAVLASPGLFKEADGGTLFLDEIGDMPMSLQVKLLRALQEQQIRPVGSSQSVNIDVRVISATHKDLQQAMHEHQFREDLYYRLNVVNFTLPPLQDRSDDIPLLARELLRQSAAKHQVNVIVFSDDAIQLLVTSNWPGNVRQLVNVIEQCVALAETTIIPKHLVEQALSANRSTWPNLSDARDAFEHTYLRKLLNMTDGNVTRAAFLAGRNRSDLHKLLKKHELDAANFRQM
ncbi:sigma 54-interacting transcriptional regulator [Glaciecola sp.]|jgi:two-component system, NtrC family, response regulator GlrR|nr:sigma 54-interacting transcriptional regulator [Glaciecola sp.]